MSNKESSYVIKDEEGRFVSGNRTFTLTNEGWLYCSYSGVTTGFTYYSNLKTITNKLLNLQKINNKYGFNKEFTIEYINLKEVQDGELTIKSISSLNCNKNLSVNNHYPKGIVVSCQAIMNA